MPRGKHFVLYLHTHCMFLYQKSHTFAALTRLISDTSTTHVHIPYTRTFHEVFYIIIQLYAHIIILIVPKWQTACVNVIDLNKLPSTIAAEKWMLGNAGIGRYISP